METDVIYDRYGSPILRLLYNRRFVSFDGQNIGFLINTDVYNYNGRHVGWYENGILRDHFGRVAGFGQFPSDSIQPLLPLKSSIRPYAAQAGLEPLRPLARDFPPFKPFKEYNWSAYDPITLFSLGYE